MLLLFGKLFFGGSSDPGGSEKHSGIKSPGGGGGGVMVAPRLKRTGWAAGSTGVRDTRLGSRQELFLWRELV